MFGLELTKKFNYHLLQELNEVYDTIYLIVSVNLVLVKKYNLILYDDELQAEIEETQRYSVSHRLKLHKSILATIQSQGYKEIRQEQVSFF